MRALLGIIAAAILAVSADSVAYAQDTTASLDTNQCLSYGAVLGGGTYVRCRLQLADLHQRQQEAGELAAVQEHAAEQAERRAELDALNPKCTTSYVGTMIDIHCK
jgi:hypothetical protein